MIHRRLGSDGLLFVILWIVKRSNGVSMLTRKGTPFVFAIALVVVSFFLGTISVNSTGASYLHAYTGGGVAAGGQLSAERAAKHIQFLASDKLQGRRAGTPYADEAAAYIEKEFRS